MVKITKLVPKERKGLVVVITSHGKGKTTTALGIAVRACGHDMRVCIIQKGAGMASPFYYFMFSVMLGSAI